MRARGVQLGRQPSLPPKLLGNIMQAPSLLCPSNTPRQPGCRRRGSWIPWSSAPQHWRTLPNHQPGLVRRPGGTEEGGPSALLSAAGWALAAMVTFNLLRSLVLMWVSAQRHGSMTTDRHRQSGGTRTSGPPPVPLLTTSAAPSPASPPTTAAAAATAAGTAPARRGGAASGVQDAAAAARSEGSEAGAVGSAAEGPAVESSQEAAASAPTSVTPTSVSDAPGRSDGGSSSLQVASYQLRPRGRKSNNNLGRVVICAALEPAPLRPGPGSGSGSGTEFGSDSEAATVPSSSDAAQRSTWSSVEWHQRFWEPLLCKYAETPEDRVTGLLLVYGSSILHILEGDNNQLFALLRELRPEDFPVHRLREVRVPCYILDLRERLFEQWQCAVVTQRPVGRRRLTRAAFRAPVAAAAAAAADVTMRATAALLRPLPGRAAAAGSSGPDPDSESESESESETESESESPPKPTSAPAETLLVGRIQQLELFVKFIGPKLSALADPALPQESRGQALRNLSDYESTTPTEDVVTALATDPLAPELNNFVSAFDADYHRYVSLLALVAELGQEMEEAEGAVEGGGGGMARLAARAASLVAEIRHLARFYEAHLQRDLQDLCAVRGSWLVRRCTRRRGSNRMKQWRRKRRSTGIGRWMRWRGVWRRACGCP